ncbi:alpha-galactosidase [Cetobacterium sp. 8H]|uniref:alpha-galactosidase n=1 Tax=Cetobacterium sp. 8H TaxID=2759681 RepID=UPI00163B7612|nr:alpha-galactosidase [Cetobacterium sp. 8H]MBC2851954.1 alpha-galactosidase [Cetobacterium sp. 8H]
MIYVNESNKEFHLENKGASYILNVMKNGQLGHLYYGKKIKHRDSFSHFFYQPEVGVGIIAHHEDDPGFSLEYFKQEYPSYGTTDFRKPAFEIEDIDGSRVSDFKYKSHKVYKGKNKLSGLPSTYVNSEDEAETLEIILEDEILETRVYLSYTVYNNRDIMTRNTKFENFGNKTLKLNRAMSLSLDLPDYNYEMIHLSGAWARERFVKNRKLEIGSQYIDSTRGASSAHQNPFVILKRPETTENMGEAMGFALVYSGNFLAHIEVDHFDSTRVTMGINPFDFSWNLKAGEEFQTPEVVMVYTDKGLNSMSQSFHNIFRERLVRGEWQYKERPILVNNWEATYFDFNEEKILEMASKAKDLGFELFVLDDGWFGKRNDDKTSLGDWFPNLEKLPNGIKGLGEKIVENGMKFGLWFEPEMISKESEIYTKHPEWLIGVKNRKLSLGRNQYILDLSKKEVRNYIIDILSERFSEAPISYVKWDMNRNMTEITYRDLPHKYILGLYEVLETITQKYPHILFESCASGGGRFDAGMLHYMPQVWTSDNTDAVVRLSIQHGTSYAYPLISMGAHVSDIPNHQTARKTSLELRNRVAYFGNFGYELNVLEFDSEVEKQVVEYLKFYKENRKLIQFGDFYRIDNPFYGNTATWIVVNKEKTEALVGHFQILAQPNPGYNNKIILKGLDPEKKYKVNEKYEAYGDELMNMGIVFSQPDRYFSKNSETQDFKSRLFKITEVR